MISTHILDVSTGNPASDVKVVLEKRRDGAWQVVQEARTNADGRISYACPQEAGSYRLIFGVEEYLARQGLTPFFLDTPISFEVRDTGRKYHVPLLLSPYGMSTYRGS